MFRTHAPPPFLPPQLEIGHGTNLPASLAQLTSAVRKTVVVFFQASLPAKLLLVRADLAQIIARVDKRGGQTLNHQDVEKLRQDVLASIEALSHMPAGQRLIEQCGAFDHAYTTHAMQSVLTGKIKATSYPAMLRSLESVRRFSCNGNAIEQATWLLGHLAYVTALANPPAISTEQMPSLSGAHLQGVKRSAPHAFGQPAMQVPEFAKRRRKVAPLPARQAAYLTQGLDNEAWQTAQLVLGQLALQTPPPTPPAWFRHIPASATKMPALSAAQNERLDVPRGLRIRPIKKTDGTVYLMTQSHWRGTSGKVRIAMNAAGDLLAFKQLRTDASRPKPDITTAGNRQVTKSRIQDIENEIDMAAVVDAELTPLDYMDVQGDRIVVTNLMSAEGKTIANQVPAQFRKSVHRIMMEQVSEKFAYKLHAQGIIHDDFKFENTLVGAATGEVHISDFGTALRLGPSGRVQPRGTGTYFAFEKMLDRPYTVKADIWELAASWVHLIGSVAGRSGRSPLHYVANAQGGVDVAQMTRIFAEYMQWHTRVTAGGGPITPDKLSGPDRFSVYFRTRFLADAHGTDFVIRRMLVPDPNARASALEVHAFFKLINARSPQATERGQTWLTEISFPPDVIAQIQALDRVRADMFGVSPNF